MKRRLAAICEKCHRYSIVGETIMTTDEAKKILELSKLGLPYVCDRCEEWENAKRQIHLNEIEEARLDKMKRMQREKRKKIEMKKNPVIKKWADPFKVI